MITDKTTVEQHLAFLIDQLKQPSAICDYEGNVLYTNEQFKNEYGEAKKIFMADLQEKAANHEEQSFLTEVKLNKKKGCCVLTNVECMPVTGKNQLIISFQTIKNKELPQSFYIDAFQKTNAFIIAADQSRKIIAANDQAFSFVKLPAKHFVGKSIDELFSLFTDKKEMIEKYIEKVKKNGYAEAVQTFTFENDDIRQYYLITFYNEKTKQFIIRIYDETKVAKVEEMLAHSEALSHFGTMAATIVHEVRNPMTSLKGFVQLLRIAPPEDMMKYLAVIESEIERMDTMLTEMLTISKPSKAKTTTFSLEVLIRDLIYFIQPQALLEGITIIQRKTFLNDSLIVGDANKIKQAILNLIKNAIESMTGKGNITIDLYLSENDQIVLSIQDTGTGMDEDQLNQIFTPFFSSKSKGTGLGMPFVKKTIECHGGIIDVRSKKEIGTTVLLTLPLAQSPGTGNHSVSAKVVS